MNFQQLMSDPQFQMGLSFLSQWKTPPGQHGSLAGALQTYQGLTQAQQAAKLREMQMEALKKQQEKAARNEALAAQIPDLLKQYQKPAVAAIPPQQTYLYGDSAKMAGLDQPQVSAGPYRQAAVDPLVIPGVPGRPASFDAEGFRQAALPLQAQIDPMGTLSNLMKQAEPKDLIKVGADDSLIDPVTRQPVYQGAGKAQYKERTNVKKIGGVDHYIKEASLDGGKSWNAISDPYPVKSTVANITQTVGGPVLEKAEHKSKGEYNVKNLYTEAAQQAVAARKQNTQLDSMSRTVGSSGWVQSVVAPAANALTSLGLASDKAKVIAKDAQTFNAAAMELVLQKQLAQKGPQTESDAMRLQQSLPKFSNVVEANKYLIDFARVQNNRDIAFQRYLDKYWAANRTYEGAEEAWYSGPGATSLFDDPIMKKWDSKPATGKKSIQEQAADILKGK